MEAILTILIDRNIIRVNVTIIKHARKKPNRIFSRQIGSQFLAILIS